MTKLIFQTLSIAVLSFILMCLSSCDNESDEVAEDATTEENTSDDTSGEELTINDYLLTATGQNTAFDLDGNEDETIAEGGAVYGQDGHYQKGETMSYTDNGDGTVTDEVTGLMWQQTPSSRDYSWSEAETYCSELDLGGYTDWRMPSLKELFSISDFENGWPYIDQTYFDLASGEVTKDEQFWSSNLYVGVTVEGGDNAAIGVNHVTGHIKAYAAESTGPVGGKYVRAVRGGTYGTNDYSDNGDGTITDHSTGLMWSQSDNGEGLEWADALSYAEASELAGYTDWRLPNIKELQGIVDYSRSPTATDESNLGPAIDPLFVCSDITSEAGYDDYPYYWSGTSAYFSESSPGYYYAWYVALGRAVNDEGEDFHGAGAVRFDTKYEGGPASEDAERYYNYVFLVRNVD